MDSNNYRIPALFYTQKGTLIAGIDRRVESGGDSPNNIDAVIRRSFDDGTTWEEDGIYIMILCPCKKKSQPIASF